AVKAELKRPPFPHKNKYGKFVTLNRQDPRMSNHEYGLWAKDCLKILEGFYQKIEDIPNEDLLFYWIFLTGNASNKSKLG
ncbi:replication initiation protein, partial [Glaesserella parasuis]